MMYIRNTDYRTINLRSYRQASYTDYDTKNEISTRVFVDGSKIRIHHKYKWIQVFLTNGVQYTLLEY